MKPIERFMRRLRLTREMMRDGLGSKKGEDEIAEALEEIKEVEKTLSWMPKPREPGNGVVGEESKRMSKGKLPREKKILG